MAATTSRPSRCSTPARIAGPGYGSLTTAGSCSSGVEMLSTPQDDNFRCIRAIIGHEPGKPPDRKHFPEYTPLGGGVSIWRHDYMIHIV